MNQLKLNLPPEIRDTLLSHEEKGTIHSAAYQKAYAQYSRIHTCRIYPEPKDISESGAGFGEQVFKTMWGTYEFYCTGNLTGFERTAILKEIKVPTLFTCGRYDVITPEQTRRYAEQVMESKVVVFEKSAHLP